MDIKNEDLQTFLKVYQNGTFSKASVMIGLSQSALSQKVARLEELLQATLFIRKPRHLELTSAGEELLLYAKDALELQDQFIQRFNQYDGDLKGTIRIASFSSIMRSVIIKKLTSFMKKNKNVSIEFQSHEVHELENILRTNQADFIITDYFPELSKSTNKKIGEEEYVLVESAKHVDIPNIYFDHTVLDNATNSFFDFQNLQKEYSRKYVGDVYGIIDCVKSGLGKAVMSKHLVDKDSQLKIGKCKKIYKRPLVLSFTQQNYYSPIHSKVLEILSS
jgi:DNA-binding transcriptional LysR family regulator